jgi:hypothetical protein
MASSHESQQRFGFKQVAVKPTPLKQLERKMVHSSDASMVVRDFTQGGPIPKLGPFAEERTGGPIRQSSHMLSSSREQR